MQFRIRYHFWEVFFVNFSHISSVQFSLLVYYSMWHWGGAGLFLAGGVWNKSEPTPSYLFVGDKYTLFWIILEDAEFRKYLSVFFCWGVVFPLLLLSKCCLFQTRWLMSVLLWWICCYTNWRCVESLYGTNRERSLCRKFVLFSKGLNLLVSWCSLQQYWWLPLQEYHP